MELSKILLLSWRLSQKLSFFFLLFFLLIFLTLDIIIEKHCTILLWRDILHGLLLLVLGVILHELRVLSEKKLSIRQFLTLRYEQIWRIYDKIAFISASPFICQIGFISVIINSREKLTLSTHVINLFVCFRFCLNYSLFLLLLRRWMLFKGIDYYTWDCSTILSPL